MAHVGNNQARRVARLLALPILSSAFALSLAAAGASAHDQDSTKIRSVLGASIEVLRGTSSDFAPRKAAPARAEPSRYQIVQGTTGWLVDRKEGRIANCYRQNTTQVGKRAIHCVWKRLPR